MNQIYLNSNVNHFKNIYVNVGCAQSQGLGISSSLMAVPSASESNPLATSLPSVPKTSFTSGGHNSSEPMAQLLKSPSNQSFCSVDSMGSIGTISVSSNGSVGSNVIPLKSMTLTNSPMYDEVRYKTEMCKNYQELGHCKFGHKCYYAHFEVEKRPTTYKHKKHKTQLCKPFHCEGFCDFGARCAFIHSKPNVERILQGLMSFLDSKEPMPRIEEPVISDTNRDRLPVFERMSN